jgi:hypothetical protein
MITRSAIHRALEPGEISRRRTLTRRRAPRSCRGQERLRHRRTVPDTTRTHVPLSTVSPDAPNGGGSFSRRDHRLRNRRLNWRTGVPALLRHDVPWLRCRRADVDRNAPSSPRSRHQLSSTPQTPTATARRRKSSERSSPTAVTRSSSARRSSPDRAGHQCKRPLAPTHHPRGRGQPEAAPHRPGWTSTSSTPSTCARQSSRPYAPSTISTARSSTRRSATGPPARSQPH